MPDVFQNQLGTCSPDDANLAADPFRAPVLPWTIHINGGFSMTWERHIDSLRYVGVTQMSVFSDNLSRLNTATTDLSDRCASLLSLSDSTSSLADINELEHDISEIVTHLKSWSERSDTRDIGKQLTSISQALENLRKIVIRFRLIATFAAIDTSGDDKAQIDGFLGELRAVPEQIAICLASVGESFRKVTLAFSASRHQAQQGLIAMDSAQSVLDQQIASLEVIVDAANTTIQAIQTVRRDFVAETQKHANSMITAFQFSDFFAQRLEHIQHMLGFDNSHIHMLASAQIGALADDGRAVMSRMDQALNGLERAAGGFLNAYSTLEQETVQSHKKQAEILEIIMYHKDDALIAIDAAQVAALRNLKEITQSQISFGELRRLSKSIDMAAINARLRSTRLSASQRTMAVLSNAVLESAVGSRNELETCETGLEVVGAVLGEDDASKLSESIRIFVERLEGCQDNLKSANERGAALARTRDDVTQGISTLQVLINDCRAASSGMCDRLDELAALGTSLPHDATDTNWPDMDHIYEVYTMDAERVVHNTLIGRAQPTAAATAAVDLDDIFF